APSGRPPVFRLPQADGRPRARHGELRPHRPLAGERGRQAHRGGGRAARRREVRRAGTAQEAPRRLPGGLRPVADREDVRLRAGTGDRAVRPAGGQARGRIPPTKRVPLFDVDRGSGDELSVPPPPAADQGGVAMKPISRRTMLRGAGAAVALPLLEAMGWPQDKAARPVRMCFYVVGGGAYLPYWTLDGAARATPLEPKKAVEHLGPAIDRNEPI